MCAGSGGHGSEDQPQWIPAALPHQALGGHLCQLRSHGKHNMITLVEAETVAVALPMQSFLYSVIIPVNVFLNGRFTSTVITSLGGIWNKIHSSTCTELIQRRSFSHSGTYVSVVSEKS